MRKTPANPLKFIIPRRIAPCKVLCKRRCYGFQPLRASAQEFASQKTARGRFSKLAVHRRGMIARSKTRRYLYLPKHDQDRFLSRRTRNTKSEESETMQIAESFGVLKCGEGFGAHCCVRQTRVRTF